MIQKITELRLALACVALLYFGAPANAQHAASAKLTTATAEIMTHLSLPDSVIQSALVADREFFEQACTTDQRMVALERQRPGICVAINEASLDESATIYREVLPLMRAEAKALFQETYDEQEGRLLIALWSSPTGQKMLRAFVRSSAGMRSNDAEFVTARAAGDAERSLTQEDKEFLDRIETPQLRAKRVGTAGAMADIARRNSERVEAARQARLGPRVRQILKDFKGMGR